MFARTKSRTSHSFLFSSLWSCINDLRIEYSYFSWTNNE